MNDFNPTISIIIPVFNGSDYLAEAIRSALDQTYNNREIIVINDGSNDNGATREVALSYGDQIRYFEKENGGVSSAFNYGIKKMRGEYFSWLSHDDTYVKEKLHIQVETLNKSSHKNVILFSEYFLIDAKSTVIGKSNISFTDDEFIDLYIILKRPFINGNTVLIPKTVFDVVGLFDIDLKHTQDYDMWARAAKRFKFLFIKKELINSRIHKNQGSRINYDFRSNSLELKYKQLSTISNYLLLEFTRSRSMVMCYLKLLMFSLYYGGEKNQYPMSLWINKLIKIKFNVYIKCNVILILALIKITLILPNRIRRLIVRALFFFSNSSLKCMFLNEK